ncbi:GDYXXLXY domain-containing protein [Mycolicibacterium sp. P9-64]|uniref:GDYXXLXY domain-containing protein n=1 Tax=Mycolicibacterium sp. P9-64 TaxID=2024612 RepID=UPI0011EE0729|nr:GDYXXLXY domain-containing protein [Mycolicibacterium sp. P9-64]
MDGEPFVADPLNRPPVGEFRPIIGMTPAVPHHSVQRDPIRHAQIGAVHHFLAAVAERKQHRLSGPPLRVRVVLDVDPIDLLRGDYVRDVDSLWPQLEVSDSSARRLISAADSTANAITIGEKT